MGKKAGVRIFTGINHKKDFAHCKEQGDINVFIAFKLLVKFQVFFHSTIILKGPTLLFIIRHTLQIAVSIVFKYAEGKKNIAILSEEAS